MDPISLAIISALTAGLASGVTKIGETVIGDAYNALKTVLIRKFGSGSKVIQAVKEVEANPNSKQARAGLVAQITKTRADHDQELLLLAGTLTQTVNHLNQNAGNNAIQFGQGNTVSGIVAQNFRGNVTNYYQAPTVPNAQNMLDRGVQLLRSGSYDEAIPTLNQSIMATPSADGYYYSALANLRGLRPKVLTYTQAKAVRQKLRTACDLDPGKGHYWYLLALLTDDFFIENGFSDAEDVDDILATGNTCPFVRAHIVELLNHASAPGCEVYEYLKSRL